MRFRSMTYLTFATAITAVVLAVACSPEASSEVGTGAPEIVGGTASSHPAFVVVADDADQLACTGALVRRDVLMVPASCARRARAIYVGFTASIGPNDKLGPLAGGATHIALGSKWTFLTSRFERISAGLIALPSSVPASVAVADRNPAESQRCEIVGQGVASTGAGSGRVQRSAVVEIVGDVLPHDAIARARLEAQGYAPDWLYARGVDGSLLDRDMDAFLLCGGALVGPSVFTVLPGVGDGGGPDETRNVVMFGSFASDSAETNRAIDALSSAAAVDAGADAAGANACASPHRCTPGDEQRTSAGCFAGQRTRTCLPDCTWGNYTVTCN